MNINGENDRMRSFTKNVQRGLRRLWNLFNNSTLVSCEITVYPGKSESAFHFRCLDDFMMKKKKLSTFNSQISQRCLNQVLEYSSWNHPLCLKSQGNKLLSWGGLRRVFLKMFAYVCICIFLGIFHKISKNPQPIPKNWERIHGNRTVYNSLTKFHFMTLLFSHIWNVLTYQKRLFWIFHKI